MFRIFFRVFHDVLIRNPLSALAQVILILAAVISGIIIDNFADMRTTLQETQDDMKSHGRSLKQSVFVHVSAPLSELGARAVGWYV